MPFSVFPACIEGIHIGDRELINIEKALLVCEGSELTQEGFIFMDGVWRQASGDDLVAERLRGFCNSDSGWF